MFSQLKIVLIAVIFVCSSHAYAEIGAKDWMNYINPSCQATLSGKAKKLFGELDFWVHVDLSMENWIQFMREERPQDNCTINYQSNKDKYSQCMAGYRDRLQWFSICKPIVVQMCKKAGGFC